ncbi:ring-cleaving dioxygenase [Paenibacillus chibensis]|uniref:ring-cleaving dioxygenase n=1 Tax=Paenibacillus chibensis TaxID=59846 RepID=UPI000FDCD003|nr:ring-cleaving dioxygenase [Paenibacillus chibensis]MEC0370133.1 ring-cleaving dioxygenase [Paenibacillus chibensis]
MNMKTAGIHHITAFVRDPQKTVDFYAGVLGLRLIKQTVNFDAPEVYHLYLGNEQGSPGTIITFFPWPRSRQGRVGGGQVGVTTFAVPAGALSFWEQRLAHFKIPVVKTARFSEEYLAFRDEDGLQLEIVEREAGPLSTWSFGGIPEDKAIKGFGGAILYSLDPAETAHLLQEVLGLEKIGQEGAYARFRSYGEVGNMIDVNVTPMERGTGGAGTVHHIAWRAKDDREHEQWREHVLEHGLQVTPVLDRQYFNALYFREAGGIQFEIATDPPGFSRDEHPDRLGEKLMLPAWFEERRAEIEAKLTPFEVRELEDDAR